MAPLLYQSFELDSWINNFNTPGSALDPVASTAQKRLGAKSLQCVVRTDGNLHDPASEIALTSPAPLNRFENDTENIHALSIFVPSDYDVDENTITCIQFQPSPPFTNPVFVLQLWYNSSSVLKWRLYLRADARDPQPHKQWQYVNNSKWNTHSVTKGVWTDFVFRVKLHAAASAGCEIEIDMQVDGGGYTNVVDLDWASDGIRCGNVDSDGARRKNGIYWPGLRNSVPATLKIAVLFIDEFMVYDNLSVMSDLYVGESTPTEGGTTTTPSYHSVTPSEDSHTISNLSGSTFPVNNTATNAGMFALIGYESDGANGITTLPTYDSVSLTEIAFDEKADAGFFVGRGLYFIAGDDLASGNNSFSWSADNADLWSYSVQVFLYNNVSDGTITYTTTAEHTTLSSSGLSLSLAITTKEDNSAVLSTWVLGGGDNRIPITEGSGWTERVDDHTGTRTDKDVTVFAQDIAMDTAGAVTATATATNGSVYYADCIEILGYTTPATELTVSFTVADDTPDVDQSVALTYSVSGGTGEGYEYELETGDGKIFRDNNPTVTWSYPATYYPLLRVTDNGGNTGAFAYSSGVTVSGVGQAPFGAGLGDLSLTFGTTEEIEETAVNPNSNNVFMLNTDTHELWLKYNGQVIKYEPKNPPPVEVE